MADLLTDLLSVEPTHCDWCLTFSGRTKKGRNCCELRGLASLPKDRRQAVYEKVRREDGIDAAAKLAKDVAAEYRRKVAADDERRAMLADAGKSAPVRQKI